MNQKLNQLLGGQTPEAPGFTEKQGQYLAFIWAYSQINGLSPAERDLQRYFRVTPPSVHQMVLTLERAGLIRRQPGVARSIELLVDPKRIPQLDPVQLVKSSVQRY
jgi:DNA-binding MarR family transcriptional regulator